MEQGKSALGVLPLLVPRGVAHAVSPAVPDPGHFFNDVLGSSPKRSRPRVPPLSLAYRRHSGNTEDKDAAQ